MLRQNVFARAEWAHLQHVGGNFKRRKIGAILIACNLIFAVLPFLATDHYADITFHTLVGLCLIIFCLGYEFHTIILAIGTIEHEKQNRTWNSLVLTGVHGNRVIVGKWLALMRYSLPTVLLLTISKVAIAYSVMQYLNVYPLWIDPVYSNWNYAFVYMSYPSAVASSPISYYPHFWQALIAFIALAVLSLSEISLLAGLGIMCAFIKSKWLIIKIAAVSFLHISFAIMGIILIFTAGSLEDMAASAHRFSPEMQLGYTNCDSKLYQGAADRYQWCVVERRHHRIFEGAQVSAASIADNGILLAANIMRPIATPQFVLRNVFSAIIALGVIALITFLSLLAASAFVPRSSSSL